MVCGDKSGSEELEISVVIPVFGCRAALPELHRRLVDVLSAISEKFEIILVDDCCPQGSWEEIEEICSRDDKVKGIRLSRNFGQIRAITAGIDRAKGSWVVVMDCDLQDKPENIAMLYSKAREGYDVVYTKRLKRKDSFVTRFFSRLFYQVYNFLTEGSYDGELRNFSIISSKVVGQYRLMREHNRAYVMFIKWLGFREAVIELEEDKRYEGKSSYDFSKKLRFACELIVAQSNKPLKLFVKLGFFMAMVAFAYIIYIVIRAAVLGDFTPGWASLIASTVLMGGLNLAALGVLGIYIGNIYEETKNRPIYAVEKELNTDIDNMKEDGK